MKRMLADVCPELINEWSQRNLPLTPDSVTHGSNKIVMLFLWASIQKTNRGTLPIGRRVE
jgi:hypothetical protein